jgi:hypothetical protein
MSLSARQVKLLRDAPNSSAGLVTFLSEYLGWPLPPNLEPQDVTPLDWSFEELHLDPVELARLRNVRQLPKFTDAQPFGVFILEFDDGLLPVGAVRRLVGELVRRKRAQANVLHPQWDLASLIFFCQVGSQAAEMHIVAFQDVDGKRTLKTISWATSATENRLQVVADVNLSKLRWPSGPANEAVMDLRDALPSAFTASYRQPVRSARMLARKMAEIAREVRSEVQCLFEVETDAGPLRSLFREIRQRLDASMTPSAFADMYAQTMVYGLLTARITHPEDFVPGDVMQVLKFENPFLDALYAEFRSRAGALFDVDEFGLQDLATMLAEIDVDELLADFGTDSHRDDPVVFFYEEFLQEYDPDQRRRFGAYYTPVPIVRFMINAIDSVIKVHLGLALGVADATTNFDYYKSLNITLPDGLEPNNPVIRALDPATGTGTYLLEWLRKVFANLSDVRQEHQDEPIESAVSRLDALELSLSSYSVAHLKATLELPSELRKWLHFQIYLADTLSAPLEGFDFSDDPISIEGRKADEVKFQKTHSVVMGNPPYFKVDAESAAAGSIGGVMRDGSSKGESGLLSEFTKPLGALGLGRYAVGLHNLYVYFWRWAIWKTTEQNAGPGIVAFITSSSFLLGQGFAGFRTHLRKQFDEVWIVDLGGDSRGARKEENVFEGIRLGVCIVVALRRPNANEEKSPSAMIRYARVSGNREEKLSWLLASSFECIEWEPVQADSPHARLVPASNDSGYEDFVAVSDIFPWRNAGVMFARTWPISPSKQALEERWQGLVGETEMGERSKSFKETRDRKIDSDVRAAHSPGRLKNVKSLIEGERPESIVRYAYRSFDRQWCISDNRVCDLIRPDLWNVFFDEQIYLVSDFSRPLGSGPGAMVSAWVPDYDFLHGRGGKDVIPLYADTSMNPNVSSEILGAISKVLGKDASVSGETLFAYAYGVLAGSNFTEKFAAELAIPGPRIPLTSNASLWKKMVEHGNVLIAAHTFGERELLKTENGGFRRLAKWANRPTRLPASGADHEVIGENSIRVADGVIENVNPAVASFSIGGMSVLKKWLGFRTAAGTGRAATSDSALDRIRESSWSDSWLSEILEVVDSISQTISAVEIGEGILNEICSDVLITPDNFH